jgi:hypothetical protein
MPHIGLDPAEIKSTTLTACWRKHHKNDLQEMIINSPAFCSFNDGRSERLLQSRVFLTFATMVAVLENEDAGESFRARFLAAQSADLTSHRPEGSEHLSYWNCYLNLIFGVLPETPMTKLCRIGRVYRAFRLSYCRPKKGPSATIVRGG